MNTNIKYFTMLIAGVIALMMLVASAQAQSPEWYEFLECVAWRESRNTPSAVSPSGTYVGYLQIGPQYVKAANRCVGYDKYDLSDRWDRERSIEMVTDVNSCHNPSFDERAAVRLHMGTTEYKKWGEKYYKEVKAEQARRKK